MAKEGIKNYGIDQTWAGFASWASFFSDVCGLRGEFIEKLKINEDLVKSCGWTWWHQNVLAISDRPEFIKRDEENRLHSQTGKAIKYRDGWGFSCWHGIVVPDEWVINPESLTPQIALQQKNLDKRRAACEILGWHKILKELNAVSINKHESEMIGELFEVDLPDSGKERFLVCCDYAGGKQRTFALNVPIEMETAHEANSWTWGVAPNQYQPEIET